MEKPQIIAEIKKILAGVDDSLEDEDKLAMRIFIISRAKRMRK